MDLREISFRLKSSLKESFSTYVQHFKLPDLLRWEIQRKCCQRCHLANSCKNFNAFRTNRLIDKHVEVVSKGVENVIKNQRALLSNVNNEYLHFIRIFLNLLRQFRS